jgi:hypothetical protein
VSSRAATWIVAIAIAAAVVPAVIAVRGLAWPYDPDGFRDIAIAQSIRDGNWTGDPLYAGERGWYSPLVPTVVAAVSAVAGTPVPATYVQIGPWLNALAPIAFFVFVRRLVGAWPAAFATIAFLFLPGRPPGWAAATYSAWLFPSVTAQALLYATLASWLSITTGESRTRGRMVVTGVLLGLTFLAHSAAAMFAGAVMLFTRPRAALAVAGIALLVASPFLAPIGLQYGFRVLNRAPGTWHYEGATLLGLLLPSYRLSDILQLALLVVGIVWVKRHAAPLTLRLLAAWAASALALFLVALAAERFRAWPSLVPAYHFFFLLRALKWVIVGCAVGVVPGVVRGVVPRLDGSVATARVSAIVALLAVTALYARYLGREAHTSARETSQRVAESDVPAISGWIREHTDRQAVFLASNDDGLRIIGPAGRHVVSVDPPFANIYVDNGPRLTARDRMLSALAAGDVESFRPLAARFGVTHVLVRGDVATAIAARDLPILASVFATGEAHLFLLR